jgi:hypothetical protein
VYDSDLMADKDREFTIDRDRVTKCQENIFRRNKPLVDARNSLEASMNLRFNV